MDQEQYGKQAHCTRCQYFIVGDGSYGQRNACTANDFYDTKVIEGVEIQTYGFDDSEYALTGIDKDRVNLEVRGKKSNISLLTDDYKVKLDLSNVKEPGTHTLPLTPSIPSGVEMVSMEPSVVTVTVEASVEIRDGKYWNQRRAC